MHNKALDTYYIKDLVSVNFFIIVSKEEDS